MFGCSTGCLCALSNCGLPCPDGLFVDIDNAYSGHVITARSKWKETWRCYVAFREIGIRKMGQEIQNILFELRCRLFAIYGDRMVDMLLFGSQARGDATSESDIDIMVVLKGPVRPGDEIARTGEVSAEISLKYDVVISCIFVSAERYTNYQDPLIANVHKEGISI